MNNTKKLLSIFNLIDRFKENQKLEFKKIVTKDSIENFTIEKRKDLNNQDITCITFRGVIVLIQNASMTSDDLIYSLFSMGPYLFMRHSRKINRGRHNYNS